MTKIVEVTPRTQCCICGSHSLAPLRTISDFPVFMGVTDQTHSEDLLANQVWGACQACGLIQLLELLPMEILYSENHNLESVGQTWKDHHQEFAKFIQKSTGRKILEIGGAHGELSKNLLTLNGDLKYTVVEPTPGTYLKTVNVVRDYIENQLSLVTNQDSIVHSHVLEHLYNPTSFVQQISKSLKIGSKMYMSFPNIEELILTGGANSLNFEHTYFLTPEQLLALVESSGFELVNKSEFRKHSFFWELEKVGPIVTPNIPDISYKIDLFNELWDGLELFVLKANLELAKATKPTFVFGAHVFTQALFKLGLNTTLVSGVLDNASHKQKRRLYGSKHQVYSPNVISEYREVRVILRATHYQDEIRNQLLSLNPQVEILE